MPQKIRLGYDILAKRAIETESGVNIDEALNAIRSYVIVEGTADDHHPDVKPRKASTKILYLVKASDGGTDNYMEWIWVEPAVGEAHWECIGTTASSDDSWKKWSELRGSSASGDESVYIGQNNTSTTESESYQLGHDNVVTGEPAEGVTNSLAMNLGSKNTIDGEGINLGKGNSSDNFGVNIGQHNTSSNGSYTLGNGMKAQFGSISIGNGESTSSGSITSLISMCVDGTYYPAEKIKANSWPFYRYAATAKKSDGYYHWVELYDTNYIRCFINKTLNQYLVYSSSWSASNTPTTGYFDDDGNFIESTDPSHELGVYFRISYAGGIPVTFWASANENNQPMKTDNMYRYVGGTTTTFPDIGTIITQEQYNEIAQGCAVSQSYTSNLFVDPQDDTATAYGKYYTNRYFFDTVDVYGYMDGDAFIPYSRITNTEPHSYEWHTVSITDIENHSFNSADLFDLSQIVNSSDNSITIGGKSITASTTSVGISACDELVPMISYDKYSESNGYIGYGSSDWYSRDINQDTGTWSTTVVNLPDIHSNSGTVTDFSYSVSISTNNVSIGSVGILDNSDQNASTITGGSIGIGANVTSTGNSVGIGHHSIYASGGSFAAGFATVNATNGSIAIGNSGVNADGGSFLLGNNGSTVRSGSLGVVSNGSYIESGSAGIGHGLSLYSGSYSVGAYNYCTQGGFVFGRNSRSENNGITISTSSSSVSTNRSASGNIVKFKNPDNVYVPISGQISEKPGYTITKVRCLNSTVSYNGITCRAVIGQYDSHNSYGYFQTHEPILYNNDTGAYVAQVSKNSIRDSFSGSTVEYWRVINNEGTNYTFLQVNSTNPSSTATNNLNTLKNYLRIYCRTFNQGGNTYVYADGFNYPTDNLEYSYIDADKCTFNTTDYWNGRMLGFTSDSWHRFTDMGGYDSGIAIGRQAHSGGSSLSLAGNYDSSMGDTIYIDNGVLNYGDGLPNSLTIRVQSNYTHANGNSIAMGNFVTAEGHSIAIGDGVRAYGQSMSIGQSGNTADEYSFAVGRNGNGASDYSLAIGQNSNYASGYSVSIGDSTIASGYSMAVGYCVKATDMSYSFGKYGSAETYSMMLGDSSNAYYNSFVVGRWAKAYDYSFAVGQNARAYNGSMSIGDGTDAYDNGLNIGRWGVARNYSISVGQSNNSNHYSIAMGRENTAGGKDGNNDSQAASIAFGVQNYAYKYAISIGRYNSGYADTLLIGSSNSVPYEDSPYGTLIGHSNQMDAHGYNTAIGLYNYSGQEAISLGRSNNVYGWSIGIGVNNYSSYVVGGHATLIGFKNASHSEKEYLNFTASHQTSSHSYLPTYTYYCYSLTQEIYTPDELGVSSGTISAISFNLTSNPYTRNLSIYMVNTTKSKFTGSYDWISVSSSNLVYSGSYTFKVGWNTIQLTTPFTLQPGQNLAIIIDDNTGSYQGTSRWDTTATDDYTSINVYSDGTNYNPLSPSSYSGTRYAQKNTIKLVVDNSTISYPEAELNGRVETNSILMGVLNDSNHYNSILVGVGNTSTAPYVINDGHHYDMADDDGFMIAIGRENKVARNYDIAIGYKSVAQGGENIALQHSHAYGYRNLAVFNSQIKGIGNVGLVESNLKMSYDFIHYDDELDDYSSVEHNLLFLSNVNQTSKPTYGFLRNVLLHTNLETNCPAVVENFIFGGPGWSKDEYGNSNTKISLTSDNAITGNIVLGSQHSGNEFAVSTHGSIIDNIIVRPSSLTANTNYAFDHNILIGQPKIDYDTHPLMDISSADTVIKNIVIHGEIKGSGELFANNIVAGDSQIYSTDTYGVIRNNIVLNGTKLYHTNAPSWWSGSSQPTVDNIVIGGITQDILNSFSMSDPSSGAIITNAIRVFNFGDNSITNCGEVNIFGGANTAYQAKKAFINGDSNSISGSATFMGNTTGELAFCTIFGSYNSITSTDGSDMGNFGTDRNAIIGCQNSITGYSNCDNYILGSQNGISGYNINRCKIFGSCNSIGAKTVNYTIIGDLNTVADNIQWPNPYDAMGGGFVQGTNNNVSDGSNIITMGNGNVSSGHSSVAIGNQLISNQWQTVIGKYNVAIAGPGRIATDNPQDPTKALFIIGNGYSTKDDNDSWKNERYITRSNAMEVYADGTVKAEAFVTDSDLTMEAGTGIELTEDTQNNKLTVSLDSDMSIIANHPGADGKRYVLECNNGVLSWVEVGATTV